MRIKLVLVVIVVSLFATGCKKKNDAAGKAGGSAGSQATAKTTGSDGSGAPGSAQPGSAVPGSGAPGSAAAPNWEKVERVPFATLQSLLPETLISMKRTNLGGSTHPDGEATYSEAVGDYQGADDITMSITIQDHPTAAASELSSKTTAFKTYPVILESEDSNYSRLRIIVGERFMIEARGEKLKVAQLKTALESVDLAKLESWKGQGIPK